MKKFREPFNGFSHLAGAITAFLAGIPLLILGWDGTARFLSALIYIASLISMFGASAAYHLARLKPKGLEILRKLDHSAIFLLIAGTYTPFCVNAFTGFWRWGLLAIIWGIAILGIFIKVITVKAPRWLNVVLYILMGWISVLAAGQMPHVLPVGSLGFLIAGGVIYTLGAIVYATKIFNFSPGRFGFHEVWHLFVIAGALAHFISILILYQVAV